MSDKTLESLLVEYKGAFGDDVPNRYKNEAGRTWILTRLDQFNSTPKEPETTDVNPEEKTETLPVPTNVVDESDTTDTEITEDEKDDKVDVTKETEAPQTNRSGKNTKVLILSKNVKCNGKFYTKGDKVDKKDLNLKFLEGVNAFEGIVKKEVKNKNVLSGGVKINGKMYKGGDSVDKNDPNFSKLKSFFIK